MLFFDRFPCKHSLVHLSEVLSRFLAEELFIDPAGYLACGQF
jgi:hypothetical protein